MNATTLTFSKITRTVPATKWIWDGYLARGQITLFTALWKMGKTTLLAHLMAKRKHGGLFLGQAISAGSTVFVSEESEANWSDRHAQLEFDDMSLFVCRPFLGPPSHQDWSALVDYVKQEVAHGVNLVIIDPLAIFLPAHAEGAPRLMLEALQDLRRLTEAGASVLLVHHPRKAASKAGATARGTGILQSFVDIILEMYPFNEDREDRRRRLLGFSRDPATPRSVLIELSADLKAYTCIEEPLDETFLRSWEPVRMTLAEAGRTLTRGEILAMWSAEAPQPRATTLWRLLDQARELGLVRRDGEGTKSAPHRYWLPPSQSPGQAA